MNLNKDIIIKVSLKFLLENMHLHISIFRKLVISTSHRQFLSKFCSVDIFWWDFSKVNVKFYLNDVKQLFITRCLDCSYVIIYSALTMFILKIKIHNKLQQLTPNWTLIIRMCLDYEAFVFLFAKCQFNFLWSLF